MRILKFSWNNLRIKFTKDAASDGTDYSEIWYLPAGISSITFTKSATETRVTGFQAGSSSLPSSIPRTHLSCPRGLLWERNATSIPIPSVVTSHGQQWPVSVTVSGRCERTETIRVLRILQPVSLFLLENWENEMTSIKKRIYGSTETSSNNSV